MSKRLRYKILSHQRHAVISRCQKIRFLRLPLFPSLCLLLCFWRRGREVKQGRKQTPWLSRCWCVLLLVYLELTDFSKAQRFLGMLLNFPRKLFVSVEIYSDSSSIHHIAFQILWLTLWLIKVNFRAASQGLVLACKLRGVIIGQYVWILATVDYKIPTPRRRIFICY